MPLPNKTALQALDIAYQGQPFVQVEAKSLSTTSLDIAYRGQPFVTIGNNFLAWVNVGGTWKQSSAVYVNVAGAWKNAATLSVNISNTWKT
jgi:hypothetical protein